VSFSYKIFKVCSSYSRIFNWPTFWVTCYIYTYPIAGASVLKAWVLCQQCLGDCHILFFNWSRQNGLIMSHTLTHKCCPGCGQNNIPTVNSCLGSLSKLWEYNFPYIEEWGLDGKIKLAVQFSLDSNCESEVWGRK